VALRHRPQRYSQRSPPPRAPARARGRHARQRLGTAVRRTAAHRTGSQR
jgi:hypothetical protein